MAGPTTVYDVTYKAQVDLSSSQHCVVVHGDSDGTVKLPTAESEGKCAGVLQDAPVGTGL